MKEQMKKISGLGQRCSRKIERLKIFYYLKHRIYLNNYTRVLRVCFPIVFIMVFAFVFLNTAGIIDVQRWSVSINDFDLSRHINITAIFTSQISVTLIVVTISSMVANLENKYIYGERATELVFSRKGLFSYNAFIFILFSLLFANMFMLVKNLGETKIVLLFFTSIIIIGLFVYRFARLFFGADGVKKRLLFSYYRDNLKHLKKARPVNARYSKSTEKFKNVTIKYIRENDVPHYEENISVYFTLLKMSLFNNRKIVQEYYTEFIYPHNDFVAHIKRVAYELLRSGKQLEGVNIYYDVLRQLNYFQVVLVRNIDIWEIDEYIEHVKYIKTEAELKEYGMTIVRIINEMFYQVYLYSITDLSYCRLYKEDMIYTRYDSSLLEGYYSAIYENTYLSKVDKNRIYERFYDELRMTNHKEDFPERNVFDFIENKFTRKEKDVFPVEIKAEPIVRMILKMIENNDEDNIKMFLDMNVSKRLQNAIKVMTILSVTEIILRNNKRKYRMDLVIDIPFVNSILKNCGMNAWIFQYDEMIDLYRTIINNYTKSNLESEGSFYGFNPRLNYSMDVVNTLFSNLFEREKLLTRFKEDLNNEGVVSDEKTNGIISELIS